jgi:hypothetical protein
MLDDFRQQAEDSFVDEKPEGTTSSPMLSIPTKVRFLGMAPVQTFILAILLLVASCLLSVFCLLITGKVVPF